MDVLFALYVCFILVPKEISRFGSVRYLKWFS